MFEFFRNEALNANDWFAKREGQPRAILRQNQYGFTARRSIGQEQASGLWLLAGHIRRPMKPTRRTTNLIFFLPLPTTGRQRDWERSSPADSATSASFGSIMPNGSNIAPQALALLQAKLPNGQYVIPTPQSIDPSKPLDTQGTAYVSSPGFFNENQWMVNGDYLVSDRNRIALRYFGARQQREVDHPIRDRRISALSAGALRCRLDRRHLHHLVPTW